MKKIIAALLSAAMVVSLCACGSEPKTIGGDVTNVQTKTETSVSTSTSSVTNEAAEDAYFFTSKGVRFTANMNCADVVAALGDPTSYYEAPSCAFDGMEKTYNYSNFEIGTYEDGELDRIAIILIRNDLVTTEEGVAVGDSADKVTSIYGAADESSDRVLTYKKGEMKLYFFVENGKVTSIEYATKNY